MRSEKRGDVLGSRQSPIGSAIRCQTSRVTSSVNIMTSLPDEARVHSNDVQEDDLTLLVLSRA